MSGPAIHRRRFLAAGAVALAAGCPALLRARSPGERLRVACIGVGGRGLAAVRAMREETMVAFCDVDDERAAEAYRDFPDVPRFKDYRRLFDALGGQIDAVTISTPDHMHYPIAVAALERGLHVFVEKPLAHTIAEARDLARRAAEKPRLQTQMGNQGHAGDGIRMFKEWIDAGVLGEVRAVHCWTNRPGSHWRQGNLAWPDHSKLRPVPPAALDWDLWLGVAMDRPYDPAYLPFNWRGYWDFGTGAMGDMGCHVLDGVHWALRLDAPERIRPISAGQNLITGPHAAVIAYEFGPRGEFPPLTLTWYEGGLKPTLPADWEAGRTLPDSGTLVVGDRATVLATQYYQSVRIVPEARMRELAPTLPPRTLPRVEGGGFAEWVRACKGGPAPGSRFAVSSRLTELCLLSNIAVRIGRELHWDSGRMGFRGAPEADALLAKAYRAGFGV
jgi:predicted dehydrogenase